jgi:hypothetical protein
MAACDDKFHEECGVFAIYDSLLLLKHITGFFLCSTAVRKVRE